MSPVRALRFNFKKLSKPDLFHTDTFMTTPIDSRHGIVDHAAEPSRYTRTAMVLHWVIAVLIICNVVLGLSAGLDAGRLDPPGGRYAQVDRHHRIGLALLRILWRVSHRPPPLPREFPSWERMAAHVAHFLLYLLMIALPLSGWAHDSAWIAAASHPMRYFNLFEFPRIGFFAERGSVHERCAACQARHVASVVRLCALRAGSDARGWAR